MATGEILLGEGFAAAAGVDGGRWLAFAAPRRVVTADSPAWVPAALAELRAAVDAGAWAAGWIDYEAAPAFDRALAVHPSGPIPVLWFGIFDAPAAVAPPVAPAVTPAPLDWQPCLDEAAYRERIERIRELIAAGDAYQVNYTYPLTAKPPADLRPHWQALAAGRHGAYAAWIDAGRRVVASLSPELFFKQQGDEVETRPMKGTAARGRWGGEDREIARRLRADPKERAENIMIVDLLRNDLGRVARPGSVEVTALCRIERYLTVLQMVSGVRAQTPAHPLQTLAALFPCGSVTGAPKIRAMQIISDLERGTRGVYTGAIGWLAPGRRACFSVAIRTLDLDRVRGTLRYGVGGGITWDSDAGRELAESRGKAALLGVPAERFGLFETLLWTPADGYALLGRHLARLNASARYFGFCRRAGAARAALEAAAARWTAPMRVRLLLNGEGGVAIDSEPLRLPLGRPLRVGLAKERVDPADRRLFHKTTDRTIYERARASRPDVEDVLLVNTRGELTESTIANVVIEREGRRFTPARGCGLLAGTARAEWLAAGRLEEAVIPAARLIPGERVWLLNSVRGLFAAEFAG